VFLAYDRTLGRDVAIKVLTRDAPSEEALERFAQEARAAGALEHPNVVAVHDVGVHEGTPFIVSELLRGRTLRARLASGPLPPREAVGLALQLAQGLAATHEHGILHRDLKPENLFLLDDGRLKILDFGLAKLLAFAPGETAPPLTTVSGAIVGTVPYMSPEQVRGHPADARSDVFAFGAILHEMLSGARPFAGDSAVDIGYAVLEKDPARLPSDTPPALRNIVRRCLAKSPDARVQSARELVQIIEPLAAAAFRVQARPWVFRPWPLAIVASIGALAVPHVRNLAPQSQPTNWSQQRLAVLPLQAVGATPDRDALCAGLSEILTNKLRQFEQFQQSLRVVSPADILRERVGSAREAHNAFGATLVVSGSVQWSGTKVVVVANLVDARSQLVISARDLEVPNEEVHTLGGLLATKVAEMLDIELRPEARRNLGSEPPPSAAYAFYLQGRGYLQRYDQVENLGRALDVFDRALAEDPTYALAHAGKAEAWLRRFRATRDVADLGQARTSTDRALALGPTFAQVHFTAGLVHAAGGGYVTAIENFQQALQIDPANGDAMRELANAYDGAGRIADAEATFRRTVELRPDSWAACKELGSFYNRQGRLQEALPWIQRVVALTPDNYAGYSSLGGLYLRLGRHQEAASALQKSLALRPTAVAYMNLGTIHYFEGRFQEASEAYRKAVQLTPSDERPWGALADALQRLPQRSDEMAGAYRQAIHLAERQADVNPHDAELRSRIAMYHAYAGDRDAADAELGHALQLGPTDGTVLFRAALVNEELGRRERALEAIKQALHAGYSREEIGKAPALEALRRDPRYARIAGSLAQNANR